MLSRLRRNCERQHPYLQCDVPSRSGHHLLAKCLRDYWGERFRYCEWYGHCRRSPCSNLKTNWQKNHEFQLSLLRVPERRYVVQYRHPIEGIVSWYLWELKWGIPADRNGLLKTRILRKIPKWPSIARLLNPDSEARWHEVFWLKLDFWKEFVCKWVIDNTYHNAYLLPYDRFTSQGEREVKSVIRFVCPETVVDEVKIERIVAQHGFSRTKSIGHFRYYDAKLIRQVEDDVREEMALLGIETILKEPST